MGGRGGSSGGKSAGAGGGAKISAALSKMKGSEKQIKWATDIVESYFKNIDLVIKNAEYAHKVGLTLKKDEYNEVVKTTKKFRDIEIKGITQQADNGTLMAGKIIDNRRRFSYDWIESNIYNAAKVNKATGKFYKKS